MSQQADLFKKAGIELVTSHNLPWMERALQAVAGLRAGEVLTGEDLRNVVQAQAGTPEHCNAYGALVSHAKRRHLIELTGEWRKAINPSSHSRMVPVYRVRP